MRQPDVCLCLGGRCWKQFCPNIPKKSQDTNRRSMDKYIHKGKILTLSESKAKYLKEKTDNE